MNLLDLIYTFFIGPLELFFEVIFSLAYSAVGNPGIAIIVLSLAMNFLVLPLYRRADALQEEERDRMAAMKPWTDHIKKTFTGDERFMMLQTYNRQMGYKPTDVFKGSISLLLEIPFFIAAYHFLSHLQLLHGVSFGPLADLGAPDALIHIGGISINFLPILMTLINVISAAVYLKGFPLSSKIQTYGIAAIFLVLLYNSPSGLVFYWTLNNLFSLVKNLVYRVSAKQKVTRAQAAQGKRGELLGRAAQAERGNQVAQLEQPTQSKRSASKRGLLARLNPTEATTQDNRSFVLGGIFFALLIGVFIPLTVIQSSPEEFVDLTHFESPLFFVAKSFALALGTFVLWFGVFYRLASPKGRSVFGFLLFAAAATAIVNFLFFGTDYGTLSAYLQYYTTPKNDALQIGINIAVAVAIAILLFVVWQKKRGVARVVYVSLSIALLVMAGINIASINDELEVTKQNISQTTLTEEPRIKLSKTGQNVVVIMLDRAVPQYVPFFIEELPELKEKLSGFTFYPNTVSYGKHTNTGSPALFGGSEYRPQQMNARTDITLQQKHNEALKVMPRLFSKQGYDVTLFDPSYANYTWIPDLSIFDDIPRVHPYITMSGINDENVVKTEEKKQHVKAEQARNFFCYSIFKTSPLFIQPLIYQAGAYNSTDPIVQVWINASRAMGPNELFSQSYDVLDDLANMTDIDDGLTGGFFMMVNNTTHEPTILQEPGYEPALVVDNTAYDAEHAIRSDAHGNTYRFERETPRESADIASSYQINMAALLRVAQWCDYLREEGIYDNTRIILCSDHSWSYLFDDALYFTVLNEDDNKYYYYDSRAFNCLLMVKDFGASGFSTNEQFMTNADVPVLATEGIIEKPTNPYTGKAIDSSYKNVSAQYLFDSEYWRTTTNNGTSFLPGRWFAIHTTSDTVNVNDPANWEYMGYAEPKILSPGQD